ncbi:hypothetical protein ACFL6R_01040 [Gemmatimonadota bacterium]
MTFFELPRAVGRKQILNSECIPKNITLQPQPEVLHHQLRPLGILQKINEVRVEKYFREISRHIRTPQLIINFNYDYHFIKHLFPSSTTLLFINDNFIAQAKPWMTRAIANQLIKACNSSDLILTVSDAIREMLASWNPNTHIFYPWTDFTADQIDQIGLIQPKIKDTVLYFGYVNHRIRWDIFESILEDGWKLRIVGPIQGTVAKRNMSDLLGRYPTIEHISDAAIPNEIAQDCFCSVAPYNPQVESVNAIAFSNRMLRVFEFGLPLIIERLPNLVDVSQKILLTAQSAREYLDAIHTCYNGIDSIGHHLRTFLRLHSADNRLQLLDNLLSPYDIHIRC